MLAGPQRRVGAEHLAFKGVGGLQNGGLVAVAADQHHADGQALRHGAGNVHGRVASDVYRETTPAMVARVAAALDERLGRALAVAAYLLREGRDSRAVNGGEGL